MTGEQVEDVYANKSQYPKTKSQIINNDQIQNSKPYDLEERALQFDRAVRIFIKPSLKIIATIDDGKQPLVCILFEICILWFI